MAFRFFRLYSRIRNALLHMDKLYQRIQSSFEKQGFMDTLGARLQTVSLGKVVITCPFKKGLTQQHGFFHAGVLTSIVDSACGYAALTTMPEGKEVLSVEFKINMMRPAQSSQIIATGQVLNDPLDTDSPWAVQIYPPRLEAFLRSFATP